MQKLPISISVGLLAGIWTYLSAVTGVLTWPAFAGWAVFFFTGADIKGIKESIPPALVGFGLGHISVLINQNFWEGILGLSVLVTVIAFIMTYLMNYTLFSLAPAAFLCAAVYFGTGSLFGGSIPFFIGLIALGLLSITLSNIIENMIGGKKIEGK
ncbi:MAG: DUF1097 domain-containing protein [Eubacteriales bacterium]|nr:DUF1097 domain-containing protein [Eubacteriales bacterium]